MCNENKHVMLRLELQAEIVLDELVNGMFSVLTPTKCHSSLPQSLRFSNTSRKLPIRKKRWPSSGRKVLLSPQLLSAPQPNCGEPDSQFWHIYTADKKESIQCFILWFLPLLVMLWDVLTGGWILEG